MVQYTVIWRRTGLKDKDFDKERNIEKLQCTVIWDQERELIKKILCEKEYAKGRI